MPWSKVGKLRPAGPVLAALLSAAAVTAAAQAPSAPPAPSAHYAVVLDAAHGGNDAGARLDNGKTEKAVALALSVRLRSLLAARGIQVITTRESDAAVDLDRRAEIANHAGAQACISLHVTAGGSGIHLFTSSLNPAQPERWAAWKTAQAPWVPRSLALAGELNSALLNAGFTVTLGRTLLPGVDSMSCPAVAVEVAPERGENQQITAQPDDPDYQARIAAALTAALVAWRAEAHQP